MNPHLGDALLAPWRSTHAALRWIMLAGMAACILGAAALGAFAPGPNRWMGCAALYCVGVFLAWMFWLPTTLLLAVDARKLRLPRMQQAAVLGLLCCAVITIGLPTLVMDALGADARLVALMVALAAGGGMAFALSPRYIAMFMGFIPAFSSSLQHLLHWPPLTDPRWPAWGALVLVALLLFIVTRWRKLLRDDSGNTLGFSSAMVMQFRRQGAAGSWSGMQQMDSGQMIRLRPDWMQPRASLRTAGPGSPVLALRIALGGYYMPKTLASHLRSAAITLLPLSLSVLVLVVLFANDHDAQSLLTALEYAGLGSVGWIGVFGGLIFTLIAALQIRQRWQRANAELPLLALLPGLGDAHSQRRNLLCATFGTPIAAQAALLAGIVIAALLVHMHGLVLLLVVLPGFAATGAMAAQVLNTFGGRQLPAWGEWLVYAPLAALFFISAFIPMSTLGKHPWQGAATIEPWLLATWVAMALALAWLGHRGWRALLRRPHPFLPTA